MRPLFGMQASFARGELAPAMWARVDLAAYMVGCRTLRNFIVHAHGGASNRPGTEFMNHPKYHDRKSRLVAFQFSEEQAYVLEFGHYYIRYFTTDGRVLDGEIPYEIASPWSEDDIWKLKFTQSADYQYIVHPSFKPKTHARYDHTDWVLANYAYKDGPYLPMNSEEITIAASALTGNITLTASAAIFQAAHVGALWKLEHVMPSVRFWGFPNAPAWSSIMDYSKNNVVVYNSKLYFCIKWISGYATNSTPDMDADNWQECSANVDMEIIVYKTWRVETSGYWRGSFSVQYWDVATSAWKDVRSFNGSEDRNYSVSEDIEDEDPVRMRIHSTDFAQINKDGNAPELQGYISFESANAIYSGWGEITAVTNSTHATLAVKRAIGSTDATKDWAEGAWSDVRGYPATLTFYPGDRVVFACSKFEPQTIWMTKVGEYNNHGVTAGDTRDDDAITRTLASRQVNRITSLVPLKNKIFAGSSGAEWLIGPGGNSPAILPTAFEATVEEYNGSSDLDPMVAGSRVVCVQNKGNIIRDVGYDIQNDGLAGADLTVLSQHLFAGHKIVDCAYQPDENIMWYPRDDGMLLGLTYMREHEVFAWHRHDLKGQVESVCCISTATRYELWLLVKRGTKRYIERMAQRMPLVQGYDEETEEFYSYQDVTKAWFVDSGLMYEGEPTKVFSGLDHLAGKEVVALADGNVLPKRTVTLNAQTGQYQVDYSDIAGAGFSTVIIGLPFSSDLETMNIEYALKDGTAQGREKQISEVTLRLENSRGGFVGPSFAAGKMDEIKMRATEGWNEPIGLFTGDKKQALQGGYDKGGRICIRQSDPLPITVLAVIPKVTHGG